MKAILVALMCGAAFAANAQPRPQMAEADAMRHGIEDYLAQGPLPWRPAAVHEGQADFIIAADGSGTHRTLQAAIDALPPAGARRHVIELRPGTYREAVCLHAKAPVTLRGDPADASAVVIVEGRWNAQTRPAGHTTACNPKPTATWGTGGSASVMIFSDDVQLAHLTIANDAMDGVHDGIGYPAGAGESGGAQAVALMTQGDRIQLDDVRLLGHQDTFFASRDATAPAARVLVRRSLIAGDVDFIFGNATLVIDDSTILSRAGRRVPGNGGHVLAPSTAADQRLGFLVIHSRLLGEPGLAPGAISLGRAWDFAVPRGEWLPGVSPNGQALVRDSVLGRHLGAWAASTSRRPFSAEGPAANRMAEFCNLQADDASREVLALNDGWAAAGLGTRGGAEAAAQDVFEVRSRAELAAALKPFVPARPRIVKVFGRIDLSTDDAGRPLGADDYRDPAYDLAAFERAYDPAIWGRRSPAGPLEDARRRSASRQAERVVQRVPSRTTLIGVGRDAGLTGGVLLLDQVDDVIVRHLHLADAYDHFPAWDPNDNASGEWNSEYDNLSLRGATRVWVDHCRFDDGQRPDAAEPVALGRRLQKHDGLLDITRQSDRITVSWNHFRDHAKTMLIGSSDSQKLDDGRLRVTLHHNHFENLGERMPRVRWGRVHVYNNLTTTSGDAATPFVYSLGVGVESRLFSEANVWETPERVPATQLTRLWRGTRFFDRGSLHQGRPVDLLAALRTANPSATIDADVGWVPSLAGRIDPADHVAARVREHAGPGEN
jgi:pectin methylesterase-like acyl-CoA thioesterase/pectate lyase